MGELGHVPVGTSIESPSSPPWAKTISFARDRLQSQTLIATITAMLLFGGTRLELGGWHSHMWTIWPLVLSLAFACIVWRLRSATGPASLLGALICLLLASPHSFLSLERQRPGNVISPTLPALIALFTLTFAATRFKRRAKEGVGLAEPRHGRRSSQIVANLGFAGLCAAVGFYPGALAALAEATADTVSSEVGQALGGPTWLLTNLRPVAPGTDGGVSLRGTIAGLAAAGLVVSSGTHGLSSVSADVLVFLASTAGLFFDSLLGATIERHGWIGNDLVNFSSTAFSALLAYWLLLKL